MEAVNEKSNVVFYSGAPTVAARFSQAAVDAFEKWQSDRKAVFEEYHALLKTADPLDAAEAERRRQTRALDIRLNLGALPKPKNVSWDQHREDEQVWRSKQPIVPVESMHPDDIQSVIRFLKDPAGVRAREKKSDDDIKKIFDAMKTTQAETDATLEPYRKQHPQKVVRMMCNYGAQQQLRMYQLPSEKFDALVQADLKKYEADYEAYKKRVEEANQKRFAKGKEPIPLKEKTYYPWEIAGQCVWSDSDEELDDLLS
jgi:hypothetical protein